MPVSARLARILVTLNTTFLLMAQYNGKAIVPLADVCRDAKDINQQDLADYLDKRRAAATKECAKLHGDG